MTTSDAVIVVDDDACSREILALMMCAAGATTVHQAPDGGAALTLAHRFPRALVVCDLSMPGMDGVEFVRALADQAPHVALLLVSGVEPKLLGAVQAFATKAGLRVVGAATKPVTHDRLRSAMFAARVPVALPRAVGQPLTAAELSSAMSAGDIEVHYMPKVRVRDGALVGVEALARWRHPRHGLLGPEHFIGLAEEHGRIWDLTQRVAGRAVAQVAAWRRQGLLLELSLNISPAGSGGLRFPDDLAEVASLHRVDPTQITIELTETQLASTRDIYDIVTRLRLKGFPLSIDDFGISNSGIEQLRRLPFTELKIDRSLVHGAARHAEQAAILEASIALGRRLGLRVAAEGVEQGQDWRELQRLECDEAQGFLITKPLPAAQLPAWAQRWEINLAAGTALPGTMRPPRPQESARQY